MIQMIQNSTVLSDPRHLPFQAAGYSVSICPEDKQKPCSLPFSKIYYCKNSCDAELLVGVHRYPIQRGNIICVPPGTLHQFIFNANPTTVPELDCLCLSWEIMRSFESRYSVRDIEAYRELPYLYSTKESVLKQIPHCIETIIQETRMQSLCWEEVVKANVHMILSFITRAILEEGLPLSERGELQLLDLVLRYVTDHLNSKITIASVAQAFYVSESTIKRLFSTKLGISFYRYVTLSRLAAAQSLILEGVNLESIAVQVGFADYTTFYRAFRQEYGISPRQFKKQQECKER